MSLLNLFSVTITLVLITHYLAASRGLACHPTLRQFHQNLLTYSLPNRTVTEQLVLQKYPSSPARRGGLGLDLPTCRSAQSNLAAHPGTTGYSVHDYYATGKCPSYVT